MHSHRIIASNDDDADSESAQSWQWKEGKQLFHENQVNETPEPNLVLEKVFPQVGLGAE